MPSTIQSNEGPTALDSGVYEDSALLGSRFHLSRYPVPKPNIRGITETICRILMFMWPFGALFIHAGAESETKFRIPWTPSAMPVTVSLTKSDTMST